MNPALITVIALGVVLVVAWDGFYLRDLIRADPATVRYLGKGTWRSSACSRLPGAACAT